jgi:signal transduction histidine kinase
VAETQQLSWPRRVAVARVALSCVALGAVIHYMPRGAKTVLAALALYFVISLFQIFGRGFHSAALGLLALFVDTMYLLILAAAGAQDLLWLITVFFLFLLAEGVALYGPVEVAVVSLASVACVAVPNAAVRPLIGAALATGALACAFAISKRRWAEELKAQKAKVAEAQEAAGKARDAERQRIASDFHDGPLQSFISLEMRLGIVRTLLERDRQAGLEDLKQLQTLAQSQVRDLRAFLHSMRPVDVDGANLVATARRTAERFQKESGIPVTFIGSDAPVGLPQEMTGEVLQMIREALHNVQKHAGATRVAVAMDKTPNGLEISVDDNGRGFNFSGAYSLEELELLRLGPASLKRRARSLNADMTLESRPGRGAGLKVRIPLA